MNLQSLLMLLLFALFIGIIIWSYRPKAKSKFEDIGKSIISDND